MEIAETSCTSICHQDWQRGHENGQKARFNDVRRLDDSIHDLCPDVYYKAMADPAFRDHCVDSGCDLAVVQISAETDRTASGSSDAIAAAK